MTEAVYNLDRETKISNNIDALDKKWEIKLGRGSSLYFARPNPDRPDAVIPKNMVGKWTKPELLQSQIKLYLKESWDQADAKAIKHERIAQAAKEQEKLEAAELKALTTCEIKIPKSKTPKAKNDSGSSNK